MRRARHTHGRAPGQAMASMIRLIQCPTVNVNDRSDDHLKFDILPPHAEEMNRMSQSAHNTCIPTHSLVQRVGFRSQALLNPDISESCRC